MVFRDLSRTSVYRSALMLTGKTIMPVTGAPSNHPRLRRSHNLGWTSGTAVGTLSYNNCTPDCASGHFHYVPGTRVILTHPVRGAGGQLVWSRVQEAPEPPGYETDPCHGGPQPLPTQPN